MFFAYFLTLAVVIIGGTLIVPRICERIYLWWVRRSAQKSVGAILRSREPWPGDCPKNPGLAHDYEIISAQRRGGGCTKFKRCRDCGDVEIVPGSPPESRPDASSKGGS